MPLALILVLLLAVPVLATKVQDIARIQERGASVLEGYGMVVGLNGTGDSAKELYMARPLAALLQNSGNPVQSIEDLGKHKSAALVWVSVHIPEQGGFRNDTFDASVAVMHGATDLRGGRLIQTALREPYRGGRVYGVAFGQVEIEDELNPRVGRIRLGAQLIDDIAMSSITDTFTLVLDPYAAGFAAAQLIAGTINQNYYIRPEAGVRPIATAIDERRIRIDIPEVERASAPAFVSEVLSTEVSESLLSLPAQVVVNRARQAIIITGSVEVSPAVIRHKQLTISTVTPPPTPTPANPVVTRSGWAGITTSERPAERARLQDLLAALESLQVPAEDQITILEMLHKSGQLHAKLIVD